MWSFERKASVRGTRQVHRLAMDSRRTNEKDGGRGVRRGKGKGRGRETETERERDKERERQTERDRERQRQRSAMSYHLIMT